MKLSRKHIICVALSLSLLYTHITPGTSAANWDPVPVSGDMNMLVILVEFADRSLYTTPQAWSDAFFDTSAGAKSLVNFYSDNSFNTLTVLPVSHTQAGSPSGVVKVTLATNHPNFGSSNYPSAEKALFNTVLAEAAAYVDFPSYDTNGDGLFQTSELSAFFVLSGYEASCTTKTPSIWAAGGMGADLNADGITLSSKVRQGELNDSDVKLPVGVSVHEAGHSLFGLPDLYDYSGTNYGTGIFSLMSYGSWGKTWAETHAGTTPVALDAWCRQYLGWSEPRTISNGQSATFGPALSSLDAAVEQINYGLSSIEYFLIENRYPEGWDQGMEAQLGENWGGGLLIQHIDTTADINDYIPGSHQGVLVEEASTASGSMLAKTSIGHATHLYHNGNASEFSGITTPNSNLYSGTQTDLSISNISVKAQTMTATLYNTLPISEITDPLESALLVGPTYTVAGTATDLSGTGLQKVEVSTDGGSTWAAAAGTTSWSYNWVLPADGDYDVRSRAYDNSSNIGAVSAINVSVDNTNPTSIITFPNMVDGLTGPGVAITGTAADNASSGLKHVEVSTDGGSNWSMAVDDSGDSSWSSWSYYWTFTADGSYTLKSRATDNSDVIEVTGPGVAVNVDTTPPDGTISINSGSGYSNSQTVSVALSANDSGSGVSQMQLSDDGVFDTEQWEDYASSRTWTFAGNGEKTLYVRFKDSLGNVSSVFSNTVLLVLSSYTPYNTVWLKQFGTSSFDEALAVAVDGTGNVYTAGYTQGDLAGTGNAGGHDLFVSKFDADGTLQWARQLGTTEFEKAYAIATDASGNVYAAGYTGGSLDGNTTAGGNDVFLVKYDTNGTKQWSRQTGTPSSDYTNGISIDSNGDLFIAGQTDGSLHGNTTAGLNDAFLMKYNSGGTRLWTKQIGTSSNDYAYGVSVGPDGSACITGVTGGALDGNQSYGLNDFFIVKYDSDGTKLWSTQYGSSAFDTAEGVAVDNAGNIYVTGQTGGDLDGNPNAGSQDIFVVKFDSSGARLWTGQLGTNDYDYAYAVCTDASGDVFMAGKTYGGLDGNSSAGSFDIVVIKYDAGGNRLWTKQTGGSSSEGACCVAADGSGNILMAGETSGSLDGVNFGNKDAFLAKLGVDFTVPESPHYEWEAYLSGGDCTVCHASPASFVPAGFAANDPGFCRSCHNYTAMAHDKNPFGARDHSIMASVTSAGLRTPFYGNITSGEYNNQPFSRLKDGDKVVCATCHNVMSKTEDYSRVWEPTTTQDDQTYSLENGGWDNYVYLRLKVYRDTSLWNGPSYVKDRKDYIVDPSEYTYDESAGTITFAAAQDPFGYIYATLEYPYLRANNSGNRLCADCHTQLTHKGVNCLTCHKVHGTGNIAGIRDAVRTTDRSERTVVFTGYSGANSFADGDTAYDGICEVCHTTTKYHRRDGTGFANHSGGVDQSGKYCSSCHTHASGFAR